ncbi:MAG TPA: hypothetical protein VFK26_10135 [Gemmatimonadaceae bacterium]|nr:hypothetical protein [Gemmatimonadaceae bacterium]
MKPPSSGGRPVAWEDAGRQIAPLLGSYSAIVVTSSDLAVAAFVALGIARAEANHRRAVIADLVGDLPPLRSLIREQDPHGITDSFLYGVSLNKIGYEVEGTPNLYVMPSGTDPVIDEQIFHSGRWKKLAAGFTQVGALLILVASSHAPGLADLIEQVDGAVLAKDPEIATAPSALVLARVPSPTPTLRIQLQRAGARAAVWRRQRWFKPALGIAAVLLLAAIGLALVLTGVIPRTRSPAPRVAVKPVPAPTPLPPRPAPETLYIAPPANPADSAEASAFAVELQVANTAEGANLFIRKNRAALPAPAVSPVPIDPERSTWYKLTAGAYPARYQADSLLFVLRNAHVLRDSAGSVTRAPLALLVDSVPTQGGISDAVRAAVQRYDERGLLVYALMQDDGGARLYAGAFTRPEESAELTRTLRGAGLKPVLVYRTGRAP